MVERSLAKAEVAGSSPVSRSNFYNDKSAVIKIELDSRGSKLRRKTIQWIVFPEPGSTAERLRCAKHEQSAGEAKSPVSRSNPNNIWRHSQAVRQRSAKPSSPVRFRVAPPRNPTEKDTISVGFFFALKRKKRPIWGVFLTRIFTKELANTLSVLKNQFYAIYPS